MNRTGVCPRETSATQPGFFRVSACGLALAGMVFGLGTSATAKEYDPTLPRVEEVKDVDGSTWKVLIVPRPLHRPGVPHPAAMRAPIHAPGNVVLPPAPIEKAAPVEKAPATDEAAPKEAPAPPEKVPAGEPMPAPKAQDEKAPAKAATKEPAKEAEPKAAKKYADNPFGIEIVPRFSYPAMPPSAACIPAEDGCVHVNPMDYALVYASIPFLRSEYVANPSYRHEATMEILFGQLRPTVVEKHPGIPRPHHTLFPFENDIIRPYSYYSLGPGAGYGRGPLPFAAPGAYGVNYNFYWPMPTVYRNY